jgi:hypothetical protein
MPRTPAGQVPKRAAAAAVATLEKALSDPKTAAYVKVKAAMALLDFAAAQANKPEPDTDEPSKIIVLPDNGRGRIAQERQAAAGPVEKAEPEPPAKPKLMVKYRKGKR